MRFAAAINGPLMVNSIIYDKDAMHWSRALLESLRGAGVAECFVRSDGRRQWHVYVKFGLQTLQCICRRCSSC